MHKGHFGTAELSVCLCYDRGKDRSLSEEPERTQYGGRNPAKALLRLTLGCWDPLLCDSAKSQFRDSIQRKTNLYT